MLEENIGEVNTKLKAYKLVHDPTVLLSLIYSKYGDIEEDLELFYINQLVYDKSSRYNIYFKEYNFYFNIDEYLKRFYREYESRPRIPKLSQYYKNYHIFFCRPRFKDLVISDLIQSYEDDRAELFYKKNFDNSISNDENDKDKSLKQNSESLSSLDNITDNKIIFTKKTKKIIDKNLDSNCGTITLTSTSININLNDNNIDKNNNINKINNNDGLISSRDINDSFEKIVHNLVCFQKSKKKIEKNKNNKNIKKKEKIKKEEKGYIHNKNNKIINNLTHNNNNLKRKTTPYMNKNKVKNKISFFSLLKKTNTINYSKQNKNIIHNKNKSNLNNEIFSPKIIKDNPYISTKLEEFQNHLIKQTNTSHHQRNKTFNFNQNQTTGIVSNNYGNNSRNDFNNLKNLNLRQMTQFNNFLTMNNNLINNKKIHHNKNKTFDNSPNFNNNLVKKIPTKLFEKNNITNNNDNNQIIIKRNNLIKSKFNLVKSPLNHKNVNNKINLNKNIKNNNFKYYNTKISPSNIFYRSLLNNNINTHKKSQTTYLSPNFEISTKNNASSPKNVNKPPKQYYNINKSDNISSKIKSKITKGRINNLNINFNNVIFNAPLSNINENINFNNNLLNNNSNSFNLVSSSNNNNNIRNNNTFLNNNSLNNSNNTNNNLSDGGNPKDKNIYIMNLKNVYNNISRNKMNLYGSTFSQTDNFSISSNNTKINYDKMKNKIVNHTYTNLYSNEKHNLFNNKKNKILIKKTNNKSGNQKHSKKTIKNSLKKSKKNIKKNNKKIDYGNNSNRLEKNIKDQKNLITNEDKIIPSIQNKEENNSKMVFISPNTTGRNIISQPINVNRNSNLFSKKIDSKKKIK